MLGDLALENKVQVKACVSDWRSKAFEDVKLNKMSPKLLERRKGFREGGRLIVPVVAEISGWILGVGIGWEASVECVDYDIQTTCP